MATPGIGHNAGGVAGDQLRSLIERIERLAEEKAALTSDIKEIFAEAKGNGFDVKIVRKLLALRRRSAQEVEEENALLETYQVAIGM
jgi:uncharacterized protein (UPF0335 family)